MDLTNNSKAKDQNKMFNTSFDLPAFLVYEDSQLVEIYEIPNDNYDIDKTEEFLTRYEVIKND